MTGRGRAGGQSWRRHAAVSLDQLLMRLPVPRGHALASLQPPCPPASPTLKRPHSMSKVTLATQAGEGWPPPAFRGCGLRRQQWASSQHCARCGSCWAGTSPWRHLTDCHLCPSPCHMPSSSGTYKLRDLGEMSLPLCASVSSSVEKERPQPLQRLELGFPAGGSEHTCVSPLVSDPIPSPKHSSGVFPKRTAALGPHWPPGVSPGPDSSRGSGDRDPALAWEAHLAGPWMLIMPRSSELSMSWHRNFWSCSTVVMCDQLCWAAAPPTAR